MDICQTAGICLGFTWPEDHTNWMMVKQQAAARKITFNTTSGYLEALREKGEPLY